SRGRWSGCTSGVPKGLAPATAAPGTAAEQFQAPDPPGAADQASDFCGRPPMSGSYNAYLVLCSLAIAILASYTALHMAGHVAAASHARSPRGWIAGGACAMGLGVWSMHFVAMLALRLPIPLGYDLALTLHSMLVAVAVAASALALWLVSRAHMGWRTWAGGSLLMGGGIALMHDVRMAALHMQPS